MKNASISEERLQEILKAITPILDQTSKADEDAVAAKLNLAIVAAEYPLIFNPANLDAPLRGPLAKIRRARQIWFEAQTELDTWVSNYECQQITQFDTTGLQTISLKSTYSVADHFNILLSEIIYHLRSALDQAIVAIAIKRDIDPKIRSKMHFPFCERQENFNNVKKDRRLDKLGSDVVDFLSELKPWKYDGDPTLWGISKLALEDKHNVLIASSAALLKITATAVLIPGTAYHPNATGVIKDGIASNNLEEGIVIAKIPHDARLIIKELDLKPTINVSPSSDVFQNWDFLKLMNYLTDQTEGILEQMQAKFLH